MWSSTIIILLSLLLISYERASNDLQGWFCQFKARCYPYQGTHTYTYTHKFPGYCAHRHLKNIDRLLASSPLLILLYDELAFWGTLESGSKFLRDGETEDIAAAAGGEAAPAAADVGIGGEEEGGEVQAVPEQEAQAASVLLLAPPQLSGASQAP